MRPTRHHFWLLSAFFILFLGWSACRSSDSTPKGDPVVIPDDFPAELASTSWITSPAYRDTSLAGSWLAFKKNFELDDVPLRAFAQLAVDSKYWLWINDSLVVREGGLKWGPTPNGYYYDELDLAPYLQNGENQIAILVWYFGKQSFSHWSSGRAALRFYAPDLAVASDNSWEAALHPAFLRESRPPHPNWRLAESNIAFDARLANRLSTPDQALYGFVGDWQPAQQFLRPDSLLARPRSIPQWKDFGLRAYINEIDFPYTSRGDTLIMQLPYNAQITPSFAITSPSGLQVEVRTDNYRGGGPPNVRTDYITTEGYQVFETPGWMNGHRVRYYFPQRVIVHDLRFRESGFATEFTGSFNCEDDFYNRLWQKALRTLYVTMRDNYMDCPDRERAQWWGDVVLESGETFYAMDRQSDLLTRKAILELMEWQKPDSTIYSPVPAGNWNKELPTQMLASVGYYGIWNYYWHTGDIDLIKAVYPAVKRYLAIWQTDDRGLVISREGGWTWGDWGDEKDMSLIFNGWYYLALDGYSRMAKLLGKEQDRKLALAKMQQLKAAFNELYWTGTAYRSPQHTGETDDRGQALAVVSGIAPERYYPALRRVFASQRYASPYFEKYVLEALFKMDYAEDALRRMKDRFGPMVESPLTTLWEGWDIGSAKWGGGTYNHAWSGGGLTLLSQYVAGIAPLEPGYQKVRIAPQMGFLKNVMAKVDTPLGLLEVRVKQQEGNLLVEYDAPAGMKVVVEKQ